jgi:hypothetical protein
MVTLGRWSTPGGTENQQVGTFMHELGHSLGLGHGGGDEINFKPNYFSIMNYLWQLETSYLPIRPFSGWSLQFSGTAPLPTLFEGALSEVAGIGGNVPGLMVPFTTPNASGPCTAAVCVAYAPFSGPVDWNGSGGSPSGIVSVNINNFGGSNTTGIPANQQLVGHNDWANLRYDFKGSPSFSSGSIPGSPPVEMDHTTYTFLNSLPPPPPYCYANCDGSSGTPALTANDFMCFIGHFAAMDSYANCDQSTGTPALTGNDFACFLNNFAAGCP